MASLVSGLQCAIRFVLELPSARLVGNIPGKAIEKGEILSAYVGSGPPQGNVLKVPLNLDKITSFMQTPVFIATSSWSTSSPANWPSTSQDWRIVRPTTVEVSISRSLSRSTASELRLLEISIRLNMTTTCLCYTSSLEPFKIVVNYRMHLHDRCRTQ